MYLPPHFAETRPEALRDLMHQHGLATLITLASEGLTANHIPLEYDPVPAPWGTLRGHVARANPVWHDFSAEVGALAVFQGPQAYITPSWYPSKAATGRVVPTYNYLVVHAHGSLHVIDDPAWVRAFVTRLTERYESERPRPWAVSDAPSDFIDQQLRAIVGIEIPITKLVGKWKNSQNRPSADQVGVAQGLLASRDPSATVLADWIERDLAR